MKEGTSDTSNTKCSFCKGKDRLKSLRWPVEKKTMCHELCKLTMIDSDASVHVCPLNNGQGDGFRKLSETRPLPGAEMQQREMRQMSCGSEAGSVTAIYRVLDMRRSIWSLRSMLDSGCDVYFAKVRCWIAKNNGKELDVHTSTKHAPRNLHTVASRSLTTHLCVSRLRQYRSSKLKSMTEELVGSRAPKHCGI